MKVVETKKIAIKLTKEETTILATASMIIRNLIDTALDYPGDTLTFGNVFHELEEIDDFSDFLRALYSANEIVLT